MVVRKRRITAKGLLRFIDDAGGEFFHSSRVEAYRKRFGPTKYVSLEEYFPSVVERVVGGLLREGYVEKEETLQGTRVKLTEKGKQKILLFGLAEMKAKSGKWDRSWRLVFFDVAEVKRRKRDLLRKYLRQIGLKQVQESVWVGPYDVTDEVKYLREVLDVPHSVKLALVKEMENEKDLKTWFGLD